jgi:hypothetical protein
LFLLPLKINQNKNMENYEKENMQFVTQVVNDLLAIPNLEEDVNPLLTVQLRQKFQKAGERFTEILASFNALPGVKAEMYSFDSNPDALLEINIPATSLFLHNKEAYNDQGRTNEIISIIAGFHKAEIFYTDLGERNKPNSASEVCEKWQQAVFGRVSQPDEILNSKGAEKQMTIQELYLAVQMLIDSYLKGID